jgi:hypothetical protein
MGAGVVGGIVLMAAAGDTTAVPVAVVITILGIVSSILAAVAVVRPRSDTALARTAARRHVWKDESAGISGRTV